MKRANLARRFLAVLCLFVVAAGPARAQAAQAEYKPHEGQEGKDVIWLPTSQTLVDRMLDMAKVTAGDYVIDLGSGDGRTVIAAAKRGARSLGIEYNPDMVELSKRNAARAGVADRARFVTADLFESDFSQATVITMFLLPEINLKLRPKLLDLKPGTRIVSNSFDMGEWTADRTAVAGEDCSDYCTALLWIVPAKVEGIWRLAEGQLELKQEFQRLSGTLKSGRNNTPITNGRLDGDRIAFDAGAARYTGRVNGNAMEGTFRSGDKSERWKAERY